MTEGRSIEDPQIDLEQRKAQAAEFSEIVRKSTRAAGIRRQVGGSLVLDIKFGLSSAIFEADNLAKGDNHTPDRLIIERQAEQYEDKGDIAIFRVNEEGVLVRDLTVWDDTETISGAGFKALALYFPVVKDREVGVELGELLIRFARSPLLGKETIAKFLEATEGSDLETLEAHRAVLAERSQKNKATTVEHRRRYMRSNPGFISDDNFDSENLM